MTIVKTSFSNSESFKTDNSREISMLEHCLILEYSFSSEVRESIKRKSLRKDVVY